MAISMLAKEATVTRFSSTTLLERGSQPGVLLEEGLCECAHIIPCNSETCTVWPLPQMEFFIWWSKVSHLIVLFCWTRAPENGFETSTGLSDSLPTWLIQRMPVGSCSTAITTRGWLKPRSIMPTSVRTQQTAIQVTQSLRSITVPKMASMTASHSPEVSMYGDSGQVPADTGLESFSPPITEEDTCGSAHTTKAPASCPCGTHHKHSGILSLVFTAG